MRPKRAVRSSKSQAVKPEKSASGFHTIDEAIAEIRAGRMVIVTDDADRENEGDLVMAASKVTAKAVNFMATYGRGLICVPLTSERVQSLGLPRMTQQNREAHRTDFTVSVDAAEAISTGISAPDRAKTIRLLASEESVAAHFVQPGHVFPLQAMSGGVLQRAGHTEAAVDLARLARLPAAGVICEILRTDGHMARLPELKKFASQHQLKMVCIRDLIEYRRQRERLIQLEEEIRMPTDYGEFRLRLYSSTIDGQHHIALVKGKIDSQTPTLVRVHSECLTGDVFASRRCDCGTQLHRAMRQIEAAGSGVLVYMRQEGRGIGLPMKIHAYKLQEQGLDTVEANRKLGFAADLREYGLGAQILADVGVKRLLLMTNNPRKVIGLGGYGLEIVDCVPIISEPNPHNERYLRTKKIKLGHRL